MQRNQWNSACEQLLKHWQRSGIAQFPTSASQSVATAKSWLEDNASGIFDTNELVPVAIPARPDLVREQSRIPEEIGVPSTKNDGKRIPFVKVPERPIIAFPERTAWNSSAELGNWDSTSIAIEDRNHVFEALNAQVVACRKCEEIVCRRQRTVFGVGAINARVVMFGEAPGADEDRIGEPFVGAAGQLLDKILVASGLKRAEVYIVNALKCRPPNNRTPTEMEIENCRPYFETQLETIRPEYIVCWGSVAVRAVLGSRESVGRLRGKFHAFRGAKVMVTYHPAYLLRTPDAKKLTWEDMKMLMKDMGIPVSIPAESSQSPKD